MATRNEVLSAINEFLFLKSGGTQSYFEAFNDNSSIELNTTTSSVITEDPIFGIFNNITIGFDIHIEGHVNVKITNIPFNPDDSFLSQLAAYAVGLVDCFYTQPIEYSDLVKEFSDISQEFEETHDEISYDYPMDNYEAIMAILALPEPLTEDDYLPLVSNPYAGQTEEKSWYSRPDTKRTFACIQRAKWKRQGRQLKKYLSEYDDLSFS